MLARSRLPRIWPNIPLDTWPCGRLVHAAARREPGRCAALIGNRQRSTGLHPTIVGVGPGCRRRPGPGPDCRLTDHRAYPSGLALTAPPCVAGRRASRPARSGPDPAPAGIDPACPSRVARRSREVSQSSRHPARSSGRYPSRRQCAGLQERASKSLHRWRTGDCPGTRTGHRGCSHRGPWSGPSVKLPRHPHTCLNRYWPTDGPSHVCRTL